MRAFRCGRARQISSPPLLAIGTYWSGRACTFTTTMWTRGLSPPSPTPRTRSPSPRRSVPRPLQSRRCDSVPHHPVRALQKGVMHRRLIGGACEFCVCLSVCLSFCLFTFFFCVCVCAYVCHSQWPQLVGWRCSRALLRGTARDQRPCPRRIRRARRAVPVRAHGRHSRHASRLAACHAPHPGYTRRRLDCELAHAIAGRCPGLGLCHCCCSRCVLYTCCAVSWYSLDIVLRGTGIKFLADRASSLSALRLSIVLRLLSGLLLRDPHSRTSSPTQSLFAQHVLCTRSHSYLSSRTYVPVLHDLRVPARRRPVVIFSPASPASHLLDCLLLYLDALLHIPCLCRCRCCVIVCAHFESMQVHHQIRSLQLAVHFTCSCSACTPTPLRG